MPAAGDRLRVSIEAIVPGGAGLARHEGVAVMVPLAAPGDELSVRVAESRRGFIRASIDEVISPGPGRTSPACGLFGVCGGCDLMQLSYPAQVDAKKGLIADAWRRIGGLGELPGCFRMVETAPFAYRNRAQFHVGGSGALGFSAADSARVVPIGSCPVLVPPLGRWLEDAASGLERPSLASRQKPPAAGDRFIAFSGGGEVFVEGLDDERSVELLGRSFKFKVGGFFQSNLAALEEMVPEVADVAGGDSAADLYCGVGLFGAFIRERFGRLVCVERDGGAIACARANVDADVAAMGVEDWIATPRAKGRFDHVVVDPPRAGLSEKVRAWLAESKPASIGYVSCDPVSLARDSGFIARSGYGVSKFVAVDFYPQTSHVESYVLFQRR